MPQHHLRHEVGSSALAILVVMLLAAPVAHAQAVKTGTSDRPNIVYIMADELGYYELSCMGHPHIKTPRIDRMAKEGVRFTQAVSGSSVCAPTRCCLMTGKHSGHTSVRSNGGGTPLRAGEVTVASVLKKAGYATGGFGKWGCGGRGSTGVPEKHGFDQFFGYYDQVHAHSYYPPYLIRNSREVPLPGNRGGSDGATYAHYQIVDSAMAFIRQNKGRPFFCYMPITPPHGIFDIPDKDAAWQIYKDKPWPEQAKRYAAMVSMVDRQVGAVLDLLTELKLDKKTVVFFCGDNGGNDYFSDAKHPRGFHAANVDPKTGVEFRGKKGTLYEGGLRIPMIARWPHRIAPNRVSNLNWYFPDFLPTAAELAKVASGESVPSDIDGISIVPELLGEQQVGRPQGRHEYLYWELGGQVAVRHKDWKAVRPGSKADWELYDLSRDASERHNVASEHPEIAGRLKQYAIKAHEPVREGVFTDTALHEKDRLAKFGGARPPGRTNKVHELTAEGLLKSDKWKIVHFSSEAAGNQKHARNAIDGDPRTWWHTQFQPKLHQHPHELVIDLGRPSQITGFRYLARQDRGWNGAIAKCELAVSDSADEFGAPVIQVTFRKNKREQQATCKPIVGRYVRLRILSEINGGPWASIAELGIIGTLK